MQAVRRTNGPTRASASVTAAQTVGVQMNRDITFYPDRRSIATPQGHNGGYPFLPPFLRELLDRPPTAGAGVHTWLFQAARHLHARLPAGEIVQLLTERVVTCGRHVPRSEIVAAVQSSLTCSWQPRGPAAAFGPGAKWPEPNLERLEAIAEEGAGLANLWETSPTRIADDPEPAEAILDRLFPGNPLLCCGRSQSAFDTQPRVDWRGQLARLQFIVPSPMSARLGRKKNPQPGQSP